MFLLPLILQSTKMTRLYSLCLQASAALAQATDQILCNRPRQPTSKSPASPFSLDVSLISSLQHVCCIRSTRVQNSIQFCNHALSASAKKKAVSMRAGGRGLTKQLIFDL